ncbi:hypothetical protein XH96_32090 [Bradyrhizobium sp. CCBAU 51765]|nr:hypothetical protein XH96_32090 [Bradyrhizobium sp. CCBAU 51765]
MAETPPLVGKIAQSATRRNLHSTWDNCLVVHAVGSDVKLAADKLLDAITDEQIAERNASDPHAWANESFAISEAAETGYCTFHGKSCDPPDGGSVTIDGAYLAKSDVIIRERLHKAGIRLAHLLDSVLAD